MFPLHSYTWTIEGQLHGARPGKKVLIRGWIRTSRFSKNVTFLHVYDGSYPETIQVVMDPVGPEMKARLSVGAAVQVWGELVESPGPEQPMEVKASKVKVVGDCDSSEFPIQKKETSREFLRQQSHLRPKVEEFQTIFRVRNKLSMNIHDYFQAHGFFWVHTPLITGSDCEGAGEMFGVSADKEYIPKYPKHCDKPMVYMGPIQGYLCEECGHLQDRFVKTFFDKDAHLTVSGQLHVEAFAQALSRVYTFGPTFRAEDSNTARHASEFWMIEPELAFADLKDVMELAEDFLKFVIMRTGDPMLWPDQASAEAFWEKEKLIKEKPFASITYAEAQEILQQSGKDFQHPIGWGESIQTEHEMFLADEYFQGPVFVTHYPVELKPFYMYLDDDQRTVACFDLLFPRLGEIIGGSQREHRLDVLIAQMEQKDMSLEDLEWYLDLRRFGSVPHGGFGLGLDRLLMWITDTKNIRDTIPFPRTPGSLRY